MRMTRLFVIILMIVFCCGVMSACNQKETSQSTTSENSVTSSENTVTSSENTVTTHDVKKSEVIDDALKSLSELDQTESSLDMLNEDELLIP